MMYTLLSDIILFSKNFLAIKDINKPLYAHVKFQTN